MKVLMKKTNKVEEVNDSYALNFLVPKGLAQIVSGNLERKLEKKERMNEEKKKELSSKQDKIASKIDGKNFKLRGKVNDNGELYASIGENQIKKLIGLKKGVKVTLKKPIKNEGKYDIGIRIGDNKVKIGLEVVGEK